MYQPSCTYFAAPKNKQVPTERLCIILYNTPQSGVHFSSRGFDDTKEHLIQSTVDPISIGVVQKLGNLGRGETLADTASFKKNDILFNEYFGF